MTRNDKLFVVIMGALFLLGILSAVFIFHQPRHLVVVEKTPETINWDKEPLDPNPPSYKVSSEITY